MQPYVTLGAGLVVLATGWALWARTHPALLLINLHLGTSRQINLVDRLISPSGVVGLALLVLARIERSWLVLMVAVIYLVLVTIPVYLGSEAAPSRWAFLPHLLLGAAALLGGSLLVAAAQRRSLA